MKFRALIGCILLAVIIALVLGRRTRQPTAGDAGTLPQKANQSSREDGHQPSPEKFERTNDSLAGAYRMAAFMNQVYDSVPPERGSSREQLKGLQDRKSTRLNS